MQAPALPPGTTQRTLAIIMGGGAGTRLFPLTKDRAKPAVPLGGKYRLVDIPISNCLNSGLRSIYVLTQFNTMSLHRHIQASYKFDNFSRSFVDILAAQQTPEGSQWYQGTADAVRQNMRYFLEHPFEFYLILSGDQLYRMDFERSCISTFARVQKSRSRPSRSNAIRHRTSESCRAGKTGASPGLSRSRRKRKSSMR
jgi:ADP-glucose pyrophosphorylase